MINFSARLDFAHQLDSLDSLASFREQLIIADPNLIYLDGNSLGRMHKVAQERAKIINGNMKHYVPAENFSLHHPASFRGSHAGRLSGSYKENERKIRMNGQEMEIVESVLFQHDNVIMKRVTGKYVSLKLSVSGIQHLKRIISSPPSNNILSTIYPSSLPSCTPGFNPAWRMFSIYSACADPLTWI